jgi:hypothetical protein
MPYRKLDGVAVTGSGMTMEDGFAATRYGMDIENLLLQVNATLQKAKCGKSIDSET